LLTNLSDSVDQSSLIITFRSATPPQFSASAANMPPMFFESVNDATSVVSDHPSEVKKPRSHKKGFNHKDFTSDEGSTVLNSTSGSVGRSVSSNVSNASSKKFSISKRTAFDDCSVVSSLSNTSSGQESLKPSCFHNYSGSMYPRDQHKPHPIGSQKESVKSRKSPKHMNSNIIPPIDDANVINGIMYVNYNGNINGNSTGNYNGPPSDSLKVRTKLNPRSKKL